MEYILQKMKCIIQKKYFMANGERMLFSVDILKYALQYSPCIYTQKYKYISVHNTVFREQRLCQGLARGELPLSFSLSLSLLPRLLLLLLLLLLSPSLLSLSLSLSLSPLPASPFLPHTHTPLHQEEELPLTPFMCDLHKARDTEGGGRGGECERDSGCVCVRKQADIQRSRDRGRG